MTVPSTTVNNFQFFESSAEATKTTFDPKSPKRVYPWYELPIGKSFFINTNDNPVKFTTIRASASRMGDKLNRKFRVIEHPEGIEVARLPDPVTDENVNQIVNEMKDKAKASVGIQPAQSPWTDDVIKQKIDFFGDKKDE